MNVFGGAKGDRTPDLYNAIVALSQLSYDPFNCCKPTNIFSKLQALFDEIFLTKAKILFLFEVPKRR